MSGVVYGLRPTIMVFVANPVVLFCQTKHSSRDNIAWLDLYSVPLCSLEQKVWFDRLEHFPLTILKSSLLRQSCSNVVIPPL